MCLQSINTEDFESKCAHQAQSAMVKKTWNNSNVCMSASVDNIAAVTPSQYPGTFVHIFSHEGQAHHYV